MLYFGHKILSFSSFEKKTRTGASYHGNRHLRAVKGRKNLKYFIAHSFFTAVEIRQTFFCLKGKDATLNYKTAQEALKNT